MYSKSISRIGVIITYKKVKYSNIKVKTLRKTLTYSN